MSSRTFDRDAFWATFAAAGRLGKQALSERQGLLRAAVAGLEGEERIGLVEECYRSGDNAEKAAVLRTLPELPDPERYCLLAVEACRTNVVPVFEAIACENPYPAAYFPDANFNQLVLKALFLDVSDERIVGLEGRVNRELHRMLEGFAAERRAAGRPVPAGVPRLLALPAHR